MRVRALLIAGVVISSVVALLSNSFGRVQRVDSEPKTRNNRTSARPQKSFKNRYGVEMIYIPPGEFMMGSEKDDREKPVHRVRIGYDFYMSRCEITQVQWQAAVGKLPIDPEFRGHNLPVDNAEFEDAVNFMNKLNKLNDGYSYRLPSEAEWEYACRAGTTGDYYGDLDKIAFSQSSERTFIGLLL
jgi:formylglycine-generating enzyme required for sulfatase activity